MQDEEWGANRPGEGQLVVFAFALVGEDAVGTGVAPIVDVGGEARPEKALADAV